MDCCRLRIAHPVFDPPPPSARSSLRIDRLAAREIMQMRIAISTPSRVSFHRSILTATPAHAAAQPLALLLPARWMPSRTPTTQTRKTEIASHHAVPANAVKPDLGMPLTTALSAPIPSHDILDLAPARRRWVNCARSISPDTFEPNVGGTQPSSSACSLHRLGAYRCQRIRHEASPPSMHVLVGSIGRTTVVWSARVGTMRSHVTA
ncbi:hypothetical protein PaG_04672 [Moesziomyces aphidis]|jgi:hypothetical protein|uniref:Uncharacterized protein n=1 Tax=Moesziomyces aphidis TaxID=84754 RepID=W3VGT2_MOEAP|nr:hypothetical protein PaG_04672 [Moesziomyces aphidis]